MKKPIPLIICSGVVVIAMVIAGIFLFTNRSNDFEDRPLAVNDGMGDNDFEDSPLAVNDGNRSNDFEDSPLAVNDGMGNYIYYGMRRNNVERILGNGEPHNAFPNIVIYEKDIDNSVVIMYRDDIAVMIEISAVSAIGWQTSDGVYIGMSEDRLLELYNSFLSPSGVGYILHFDNNFELLHIENDNGNESITEYIISFIMTRDENNTVIGIMLGDKSAMEAMR